MPIPIDQVRFSILDVETTGLFPSKDRVVEIAVVVTDSRGTIFDRFESLVNPNRDVGPTSIHGISAGMVSSAPVFREIAGDVLHRIAGSIVVGHNVSFDARFLRAEVERLGFSLRSLPTLDTISLYRSMGPDLESHQLARVCESCGVALDHAHSAAADAMATAQVMVHLLRDAHDYEVKTVEDLCAFGLKGDPSDVLSPGEIPIEPRGIQFRRTQANHLALEREGSYITNLVRHLVPTAAHPVSDEAVGGYIHLLDRVLEDRLIEDHEQDRLLKIAAEWGFSQQDVVRAHRTYLGIMVSTALSDGIVTESEFRDLQDIARLLGQSTERLNEMIDNQRSCPVLQSETAVADTGFPQGTLVCFTGETPGPSGDFVSRVEATQLAESVGLVVAKTVTKKLDVLVVADPHTQSGKAQKARQYGKRVVSAVRFWQALGLS